MRCKRCENKRTSNSRVTIICRKCGKETEVNLYNNNKCTICNERDGTCTECGRPLV